MKYNYPFLLCFFCLFNTIDARLQKKSRRVTRTKQSHPVAYQRRILKFQVEDFTPLMKAVYDPNPEKVKALIAQGADVNAAYSDSMGVKSETALMIAAALAELEIMDQLIKAGADVNAVAWSDFPHAGNPVLRYAIDTKSVAAVKKLLNENANPNAFTETSIVTIKPMVGDRNAPLLSYAIYNDAPIEIITALIQAGVHVNKKSMLGLFTPLMVAALKNNDDAIKALLKAGADKTIKNEKDGNKTALDYLKEHKDASPEIIKMLQ